MVTSPVPSRTPYRRKSLVLLFVWSLVSPCLSGTEAKETHRFAANPNGNVVFDLEGLRIWQKCPLGQQVTSDGCTGDSFRVSYRAALALCIASNAGEARWTLPVKQELVGISDCYHRAAPVDAKGRMAAGTNADRKKDLDLSHSSHFSGCSIVGDSGKRIGAFPGANPGPLWFRTAVPGESIGSVDVAGEGRIANPELAGVLCTAEWDGGNVARDFDGKKWNDNLMRSRLSRKAEEYRLVLLGSIRSKESRAVWIRAITRYLEPAPGREERALSIYETMEGARKAMAAGSKDHPLHGEAGKILTIPGLRVALVYRTEMLLSPDARNEIEEHPEVWKYSSGDWYLALHQP